MSESVDQFHQMKSAMRAVWMAGDFGVIAKMMSSAGEEFAERLAIAPGDRVLDVACGTGNVAFPLARRGAQVTGIDIAPNLLEQGRERAAAEHLTIAFDEGDAEQLPYPDASFDAVVSMFGAMFAPRPAVVAEELARVLKPGGLLAMANWNAASFTGKIFRVGAKHVPPPAALVPPILWGDEATVRERLGPYFTDIHTEIRPVQFDHEFSPAGAVQMFREYFGPMRIAFSRLDAAGQAAYASDLEALWSGANTSTDPDRTIIQNEYLEITGRRA